MLQGTTYEEIRDDLQKKLIASPHIFKAAQESLSSLEAIPVTEEMRDRWEMIGMPADERAALETRLANLGTMATDQ